MLHYDIQVPSLPKEKTTLWVVFSFGGVRGI